MVVYKGLSILILKPLTLGKSGFNGADLSTPGLAVFQL
jgi:hypothetical protein